MDLAKTNGASTSVPVPVTYVIGQNGKIKFAYFNPDYRQQVTVTQVAQTL